MDDAVDTAIFAALMKPLTLAQIADACHGTLHGGDPQATVSGIATDSRRLEPGEAFVALKGETHDGHDYVEDACRRGAAAVIVSRPVEVSCASVSVADTLVAYGRLGAAARAGSSATVMAVTGSAGKTTTKDMLGAIAALDAPTLTAPGTENNEIGVPRALLGLSGDHRYCVLELAMRGPGEIAYLAGLCRPHIGVITNIGEAHVGRLGSREGIAKAKAELLAALPPDGRAVLNADDFFFGLHMEMAPCPVVSFGLGARPAEVGLHVAAEDVRARGIEPARFWLRVDGRREAVALQLPGRHNVANALAAAAAALCAGIGLAAVKAGLEGFAGAPMRSRVIHTRRGHVIIDDTYNASPTSTPEALRMLGQCEGRRIFVFGDMLELGQASEQAHRMIGRLVVETGVDWLIAVGEQAAVAAEEAEAGGVQVNVVEGAPEAVALVEGALEPGDTVLVKASRGVALEDVVRGLSGDA